MPKNKKGDWAGTFPGTENPVLLNTRISLKLAEQIRRKAEDKEWKKAVVVRKALEKYLNGVE
jgi:predicted DNA-binding protein